MQGGLCAGLAGVCSVFFRNTSPPTHLCNRRPLQPRCHYPFPGLPSDRDRRCSASERSVGSGALCSRKLPSCRVLRLLLSRHRVRAAAAPHLGVARDTGSLLLPTSAPVRMALPCAVQLRAGCWAFHRRAAKEGPSHSGHRRRRIVQRETPRGCARFQHTRPPGWCTELGRREGEEQIRFLAPCRFLSISSQDVCVERRALYKEGTPAARAAG